MSPVCPAGSCRNFSARLVNPSSQPSHFAPTSVQQDGAYARPILQRNQNYPLGVNARLLRCRSMRRREILGYA